MFSFYLILFYYIRWRQTTRSHDITRKASSLCSALIIIIMIIIIIIIIINFYSVNILEKNRAHWRTWQGWGDYRTMVIDYDYDYLMIL